MRTVQKPHCEQLQQTQARTPSYQFHTGLFAGQAENTATPKSLTAVSLRAFLRDQALAEKGAASCFPPCSLTEPHADILYLCTVLF